jgi:hypothetical protein
MSKKQDLKYLKHELDAENVRRKATIAALTDWIGFVASKAFALFLLICGGIGVLNPLLIPRLTHPEMLLGSAMALLTGKSLLGVISKILKVGGL